MKDAIWKVIKTVGLGALDILLLIMLSLGLARSVAHQFWIAAQICLLGILFLLISPIGRSGAYTLTILPKNH
jgi:hypothetical protein